MREKGQLVAFESVCRRFSFSMAINRYDLRKDYEKNEANAIAAEDIWADLLTPEDVLEKSGSGPHLLSGTTPSYRNRMGRASFR